MRPGAVQLKFIGPDSFAEACRWVSDNAGQDLPREVSVVSTDS